MYSILSLNTWKCEPDYRARCNLLKKNLFELAPDIIALQEAFETADKHVSTTNEIAASMQMYSFSSSSRYKQRFYNGKMVDSYSNVSLLSKHPFFESEILPLQSNSADGGREAVIGVIQINSKKLAIASIHLSHLRNIDLKIIQMEQIIRAVNNYSCDARFICGDFNLPVNHPDLQRLLKNYGYADTSVFSANYGHEVTLEIDNRVGIKIDHILYNTPVEKVLDIQNSGVVMQYPDNETGVKVSDHNGVMSWFNIF